jgi:hypothetical protein
MVGQRTDAKTLGRLQGKAGVCIWVFLLTFLYWLPSLNNDFTYDDRPAAMGKHENGINHSVNEVKPTRHYFSTNYWESFSTKSNLFRPITVLSFAIRHKLFGDNPLPAHLFNIFLAALGAVLVFLLLGLLEFGVGISAACAMVFSTHALHTEVVANVVGRAELLGFAFGLSACLVILRAHQERGTRAGFLRVLGAILFFFAFCSKESALNWLAFLPLLAFCLRQKGKGEGTPFLESEPLRSQAQTSNSLFDFSVFFNRRMAFTLTTAILPALFFLYLRGRMIAQLPPGPDLTINWTANPLFFSSTSSRILTAILMEGWGLLQTLAPFWLSADYGPHVAPLAPSLTSPTGIAALLVGVLLLITLGAGFVQWKRRPTLFLAAGTFFGFSFLTSNLAFPIGTIYGERLMFGPSLGFAILLAFLGTRIRPKTSLATILVLGLWLGASGITCLKRQRVWKNNQTFFLSEAAAHPDSIKMQLCAGQEWLLRSNYEKALIHFRDGTNLDPGNPSAWNLLGVALLNLDRTKEAETAFLRGLQGRKRDLLLHRKTIERNLSIVRARLVKANGNRAKAPR